MHLENQIKSKENQLKENKQTNIVQAELAQIKWKSGIAEHWETGEMSFQFLPSLSNRESGPPALVSTIHFQSAAFADSHDINNAILSS
jgi:hypothetical protein